MIEALEIIAMIVAIVIGGGALVVSTAIGIIWLDYRVRLRRFLRQGNHHV